MSTSGLLPHKGLSYLLRFNLKVIPLIYKGFRKGAVERPEKMSGIAKQTNHHILKDDHHIELKGPKK